LTNTTIQEVAVRNRTKYLVVGVSALALAAGGGGLAIAGVNGDEAGPDDAGDSEQRISGDPLDRASAVALDHVGEGKVTDTEVGDEESYYEVEVTPDSGGQVDVQLDRDFNVVGDETDGPNDD
jgi:uncharacterized membrane protein YkoI